MARTYTTTQVAAALGYSDDTIRRQCEAGRIPSARVGRNYRVDGDWLHRVLLKLGKPVPGPAGSPAAKR